MGNQPQKQVDLVFPQNWDQTEQNMDQILTKFGGKHHNNSEDDLSEIANQLGGNKLYDDFRNTKNDKWITSDMINHVLNGGHMDYDSVIDEISDSIQKDEDIIKKINGKDEFAKLKEKDDFRTKKVKNHSKKHHKREESEKESEKEPEKEPEKENVETTSSVGGYNFSVSSSSILDSPTSVNHLSANEDKVTGSRFV